MHALHRLSSYRIIWRLDGEALCNQTAHSAQCTHVRTYAWIPQQALLEHPNTRALVTHGGINSIVEALTYAVPMLGLFVLHVCTGHALAVIPMFADQFPNAARVQQWGTGQMLTKNQIGTHLTAKLRSTLQNTR
jgi:glucuronosyltransferase